MLSKGCVKLCTVKSTRLQSERSVLLQQAREAAEGWGKGLDWKRAGEES